MRYNSVISSEVTVMKTLTVSLPGREYDIQIERGLLDKAGAQCRKVMPKATKLAVVTDSNVAPLYAGRVLDSLTAAGFEAKLFTAKEGRKNYVGELAAYENGEVTLITEEGEVKLGKSDISKLTTVYFDEEE